MTIRLFSEKAKLALLYAASLVLLPLPSSASTFGSAISQLHKVGGSAGVSSSPPLATLIGNILSVILGAVGIIFVVLIIQSGIQYMTSAGAEDKVKEAKKRIMAAVIGIVILLAAYSISSFTILLISNAANGTQAAPATGETAPTTTAPDTTDANCVPDADNSCW